MDSETHPVPPFLPPNARLLIMGTFPPPRARWNMDFYYPNFQNDMWRVFGIVFFHDRNYFIDQEKKSYKKDLIQEFLTKKGIAFSDTAVEATREKGNASDAYLNITKIRNIGSLLSKMPDCSIIATTGTKATEVVHTTYSHEKSLPSIGSYEELLIDERPIRHYRMPSTSRAYPKSLEEKAEFYRELFADAKLI